MSPAVSKAQQQAMGIAHAAQKYGKKVKAGTPSAKIAKSMKKKDVTKFAKTKHAGLPKHVKNEERALRELIRNEIRSILEQKLGTGARFKKVAAAAKAGGARNPAAVAAAVGRKKYGKERFQKMAVAGKKKKHEDVVAEKWSKIGEAENPFASNKIRTAHDSVTSSDVQDFDRQGYPGKRHIDAEESVNPISLISHYAQLGEVLKRTKTFSEVAENISQIAELAETTVMEEAGDWFDAHTIKRNMKEMKNYAKQFGKIAEDIDILHQRATALYDDMGNVLSRYFEITGDGKTAIPPAEEPDNNEMETEQGLANFGAKKAAPFTSGDPRAEKGRRKWDARDGIDDEEDEEVREGYSLYESTDMSNQDLAKAIRTLRTPKAFTRVANNMTRDQALDIVRKHGAKNIREAKIAIMKEAMVQFLGEDFIRRI